MVRQNTTRTVVLSDGIANLRITAVEPELRPEMRQIVEASQHAVSVERAGGGPGSMTNEGLRYRVLDYAGCQLYAPDLVDWARLTLPAIASALTGRALHLLEDPLAAVNINVLEGAGERYELHVDSVPWTAILFASGPHKGGELLAHAVDDTMLLLPPSPNLLLVFEGSMIPHAVLPLEHDQPRISVPVSLIPAGQSYKRPKGADDHLYA